MPEARKKVAVKKTTTKAPKKKVSVAASKTKNTKAAKPKKTAVAKKKPAVKKTPAAKQRQQPIKKPVAKAKKATKAKLPPKKNEVVLPTRMSIRAREKALALSEQFEESFQKFAYPAAMTLGLCFVLLGSYATFSLTSVNELCESTGCRAQVSDPLLNEESANTDAYEPYLELVTSLPSLLNVNVELTVETMNVTSMDVDLVYESMFGHTRQKAIFIESLGNGKFSLLLPFEELEPNSYEIRVRTWTEETQHFETFMLGSFVVEGADTPADDIDTDEGDQTDDASYTPEDNETDEAGDETQDSADDEVTDGYVEDDPDLLAEANGEDQLNDDQIDETESDVDDSEGFESHEDEFQDETDAVEDVEPTLSIAFNNPMQGNARVRLRTSERIASGVARIKRLFVDEPVSIIRIGGSQSEFFIASAALPNGSYELEVSVETITGVQLESTERFVIFNAIEPTVEQNNETITVNDRPVFTLADSAPGFDEVTTETESATDEADGVSLIDYSDSDPVRDRARFQLQENSDEVDDLLMLYSTAVQSGDQDMIRESKEAIRIYKAGVVDEAIASESDRYIADELSVQLDEELESLQRKVETFETIRRERLEGDSAIDTDGDGISDIDERVLFKSDPLVADTDGDGFTDGAEIIKGFNPINPEAEAEIVYRSPKETVGIAPNVNLQVAEVLPVINVAAEEPAVHTTVRGKGLPNSFVTLYVYSTPTIVTVKTDVDGAFEYTFSKELEDGEHQVFVALTDNTGDIVAQSAPFTFIKEAEAFTPVDAEASAATLDTATPVDNSGTLYRTVLAMAVLALGVLLILLGVGLRANRPEVVTVASST